MKYKKRVKTTPATISEIIAAMKALGVYNGKDTREEQEKEAKRLGGEEYYRLRLINALLGIVEAEALLSEASIRSPEEMLSAHQQALESSGAMDSKQKLLGFLRWRTLRIEGPLRMIAQDEETGPISLSAAWAAEGLQQLLEFCANDKHADPARLDPAEIKNELNKARKWLMNGVANIDIMLDACSSS